MYVGKGLLNLENRKGLFRYMIGLKRNLIGFRESISGEIVFELVKNETKNVVGINKRLSLHLLRLSK